jgi:hypothetical protein
MSEETPQQKQKREIEHVVTAQSTDSELNAKANRCAFLLAGAPPQWILFQLFSLQREVAVLKATLQINPALAGVEKR